MPLEVAAPNHAWYVVAASVVDSCIKPILCIFRLELLRIQSLLLLPLPDINGATIWDHNARHLPTLALAAHDGRRLELLIWVPCPASGICNLDCLLVSVELCVPLFLGSFVVNFGFVLTLAATSHRKSGVGNISLHQSASQNSDMSLTQCWVSSSASSCTLQNGQDGSNASVANFDRIDAVQQRGKKPLRLASTKNHFQLTGCVSTREYSAFGKNGITKSQAQSAVQSARSEIIQEHWCLRSAVKTPSSLHASTPDLDFTFTSPRQFSYVSSSHIDSPGHDKHRHLSV